MKKILFTLAIIISLISNLSSAHACDIIREIRPIEYIKSSSLGLTGKVLRISEHEIEGKSYIAVRLRIAELHKGKIKSRNVTVKSFQHTCGLSPEFFGIGKKYTVWANNIEASPSVEMISGYSTDLLSGTHAGSLTRSERAALRRLK